MAFISDLPRLLAAAYHERHNGYATTLPQFAKLADSDAAFLANAKAEHSRLLDLEKNVGCPLIQRCYASAHQLTFLKQAMAMPSVGAAMTKHKAAAEQSNGDDMPSKLKALADAAKDAVADVEKAAGDAITGLTTAKQAAMAGVGKVNEIASEIKQSAADLNDFAAQTSNFPPSGG